MVKKRKKTRERKKLEFSKKLLIGASIINIIVIGFTLYMVYKTKDTSSLAYLIPSVSAEVATSTGFYLEKSKAENKIKLMSSYNVTPTPDDFK